LIRKDSLASLPTPQWYSSATSSGCLTKADIKNLRTPL
jgi:hypothetical protein